jgi:predicted TIM-barrel fold metal-dependent hydrolase
MRPRAIATTLVLVCGIAVMVGAQATQTSDRSPVDPALDAFIAKIRAVDNHTHANTTSPDDSEYDALPLDALLPFPFPVRLRPESPNWLAADRTLYGYPHADLNEPHVIELRRTRERVAEEQGDRFPAWVLDRVGTEVMLANRVAMGPGLAPPRFRWVSYVDALMLPLSTKAEAAASSDRAKLYPFEEKLLRRYLADLNVAALPPTLDVYLRAVVTPTLERQRKGGCVAVKFEAAYLRSLDFDDAPAETASRVYSRYVAGGEPPRAEYKALQDFLFRYIARESGRLGMAVHIHSFEGAGVFYRAAGSDPLLLESSFNDPTLSGTNFVIVHGGGVYAPRAGAMLWKPNVYLDTSAMGLIYPPAKLARVLEDWLIQFPEKVLFGSDAAAFGPDIGWEVAAWVGTTTARHALGIALTDMMRNGDVSRARAEEIATMVLRTNAGKLYNLRLP